MTTPNVWTRKRIRSYLTRSFEIQRALQEDPEKWPEFQEEFDTAIYSISADFLQFELEHRDQEERIYRTKRLFERYYRGYFLHGEYVPWSYKKPYGYPGDFKIIDEIYGGRPKTTGYDRLFDEHFLKMHASVATRNRKEDFKKIILHLLEERREPIRLMDLGSGPCREIKELFQEYPSKMSRARVDCYDFDENAICYARELLNGIPNVNFFRKNAFRMALRKDLKSDIGYEYDLIFSTGLFDYLDTRIATKLLAALKTTLREGGLIAVSNYRDKQSNPSAYLMEWVAEWNLVYRTEEEFRGLFLSADFGEEQLATVYEPQKIMQYCLARNG